MISFHKREIESGIFQVSIHLFQYRGDLLFPVFGFGMVDRDKIKQELQQTAGLQVSTFTNVNNFLNAGTVYIWYGNRYFKLFIRWETFCPFENPNPPISISKIYLYEKFPISQII